MKPSQELYEDYVRKMHRIADLRFSNALLQWDQETYLPKKGAPLRGQQISTLSELAHHYFSEDDLGSVLKKLQESTDLLPDQQRNIQRTLEDYNRNKKYTSSFVRRLSEQVNKAFHAWVEARKANSFALFEKDLDLLISLKIEETELLGYSQHPYDALLDEFEKGCTVSLLDETFSSFLPSARTLLDRILACPSPENSFLHQHFTKEKQWDWGMYLIKELHFDFAAGRQDTSEHPFSVSMNPGDVRITTRVDENDFANMTWSCIHETGHALYEQGLPISEYGLPLGEACSYSIHESQSRLWENNVGRSLPFWTHYYPILKERFTEQFEHVSISDFFKAINKVQPSLIRTESDEITYHFHVYIRYELEKALISGTLKTKEIPEFWNAKYKELIGVTVPDDKMGCLQDVHWSHGSFGYFPTYSLGSFYAAQFFLKATEELPGLEEKIKNGNTLVLLNWLREKIHSKGRFYTSEELCKEVTGTGLDVSKFHRYVLQKYKTIYSL